MRMPLAATSAAILAMALIPSTSAAQDIVMRRPLPQDGPTTPGAGAPTPTPTGGATDDAKPTPPTQGPVGTPNSVSDPATAICDAGSGDPVLTDVQWIEAGWSTPVQTGAECAEQTQQYTCQATYTCKISGKEDTFVSEAPDATCENFTGPVKYAQGSYPNGNDDQMGAWMARELRAMAAANPRPGNAEEDRQRAGRTAVGAAGLLSTGFFSSVTAGHSQWILDRSGQSYGNDWVIVALIKYESPMRGRICGALGRQGFPCGNYGMPSDYVHIKP